MKNVTEDLLNKLVQLDREVKSSLRKKGLIVPVKSRDGSIYFGSFKVVRNSHGFYSIIDHTNEAIITGINLPQTAMLTANDLALGKHRDPKLISSDRSYGYADFEEELYKRALARKDKNIDYFDISLEKYNIAHNKKRLHKREVMVSFEKLVKLV